VRFKRGGYFHEQISSQTSRRMKTGSEIGADLRILRSIQSAKFVREAPIECKIRNGRQASGFTVVLR
jgi:hypothetical protein